MGIINVGHLPQASGGIDAANEFFKGYERGQERGEEQKDKAKLQKQMQAKNFYGIYSKMSPEQQGEMASALKDNGKWDEIVSDLEGIGIKSSMHKELKIKMPMLPDTPVDSVATQDASFLGGGDPSGFLDRTKDLATAKKGNVDPKNLLKDASKLKLNQDKERRARLSNYLKMSGTFNKVKDKAEGELNSELDMPNRIQVLGGVYTAYSGAMTSLVSEAKITNDASAWAQAESITNSMFNFIGRMADPEVFKYGIEDHPLGKKILDDVNALTRGLEMGILSPKTFKDVAMTMYDAGFQIDRNVLTKEHKLKWTHTPTSAKGGFLYGDRKDAAFTPEGKAAYGQLLDIILGEGEK